MKRMWRRLCSGLLGGLAIALVFVVPAHADVNNFTITQFDADYTLSRDDPQGQLKVLESIKVDFHDQNHGILRALPNTYKKHNLKLHINGVLRNNAAERWTTYEENGNTVIKAGEPNQTITGPQTYTIAYVVQNVIGFYDDHDELFWDVNGDQWAQQAEHVSAVVRLPGGAELSRPPICYTGSFGSKASDCVAGYNGFTNVLYAETTKPLGPNQTLSIVGGFKSNYFTPPGWVERAGGYLATAIKFLVPFLLLAGTAWYYWYRYGRDPKGRGVIVPEYEPPEGVSPMGAGTIADFRTDNRDITATIIDLAIRGYVRIIETVKKRTLRKDLKEYALELRNSDFSRLDGAERTILEAIFTNGRTGDAVDLNTLKYKLSATAAELQKSVHDNLVASGYLHKNPASRILGFVGKMALAFAVSVLLAVLLGGAAAFGIFVGTAAAMGFILAMPARTEQGVAAKESILGLKMYLEIAEKDRIRKLQSPDAPYAPRSSAPKMTVELFEKLLPYAMVLGVEEQWAKKFENLYKTPPDWYQGNWTTFNAVALTSALNSGVQSSMNSAFSSPSSSSSSGFSGGGAGGGGGGGGGGGW